MNNDIFIEKLPGFLFLFFSLNVQQSLVLHTNGKFAFTQYLQSDINLASLYLMVADLKRLFAPGQKFQHFCIKFFIEFVTQIIVSIFFVIACDNTDYTLL